MPMATSRAAILSLAMLLCGGCEPTSEHKPELSPQQQLFGSGSVPDVLAEGCEYKWTFWLPGPDGELYTEDDLPTGSELWLPSNQSVRLHFTSRDYIYTFLQPELEINEMAVPGLDADRLIEVPAEGSFEISSSPLCGFFFAHANYRPLIRIGVPADMRGQISGAAVHESE